MLFSALEEQAVAVTGVERGAMEVEREEWKETGPLEFIRLCRALYESAKKSLPEGTKRLVFQCQLCNRTCRYVSHRKPVSFFLSFGGLILAAILTRCISWTTPPWSCVERGWKLSRGHFSAAGFATTNSTLVGIC